MNLSLLLGRLWAILKVLSATPQRTAASGMMYVWGFGLYVLSYLGSYFFVAPTLLPYLIGIFGFAGAYATTVIAAVLSFPVLLLVLYIADRLGIEYEI